MSGSDLLFAFGYFVVIVALSYVPQRMLEQASEAAAAVAVTKSDDDADLSLTDPESPSPPKLAAEIVKDVKQRRREHDLEECISRKASDLPLMERSHSSSSFSSPSPDQKENEDTRCSARFVHDTCVSTFTLVNALILQIAQFTLAYFFTKFMSTRLSPSGLRQEWSWLNTLPGISIKMAITSLGACNRLYQAWRGHLEVLQWHSGQGTLILAGFKCMLYDPARPSLADSLDIEQMSVIDRKECVVGQKGGRAKAKRK